jgi:hypothetical protein
VCSAARSTDHDCSAGAEQRAQLISHRGRCPCCGSAAALKLTRHEQGRLGHRVAAPASPTADARFSGPRDESSVGWLVSGRSLPPSSRHDHRPTASGRTLHGQAHERAELAVDRSAAPNNVPPIRNSSPGVSGVFHHSGSDSAVEKPARGDLELPKICASATQRCGGAGRPVRAPAHRGRTGRVGGLDPRALAPPRSTATAISTVRASRLHPSSLASVQASHKPPDQPTKPGAYQSTVKSLMSTTPLQ